VLTVGADLSFTTIYTKANSTALIAAAHAESMIGDGR
jgi:hypothetical protein